MQSVMAVDKYATNAREWRLSGDIQLRACLYLFDSGDPFLFLPAAVHGHHALEIYLKALLISDGLTVFNPTNIGKLDPSVGLKKENCVWDHKLIPLAEAFAKKHADFDLTCLLVAPTVVVQMPITLRSAFEIFDPFFTELRYPVEVKLVDGLGQEHGSLLQAMIAYLEPFLSRIPMAAHGGIRE
jgi:hypothetical protein